MPCNWGITPVTPREPAFYRGHSERKCDIYDCEYIALAQELGAGLVTEDHQILEQFPELGISLNQFIDHHS